MMSLGEIQVVDSIIRNLGYFFHKYSTNTLEKCS